MAGGPYLPGGLPGPVGAQRLLRQQGPQMQPQQRQMPRYKPAQPESVEPQQGPPMPPQMMPGQQPMPPMPPMPQQMPLMPPPQMPMQQQAPMPPPQVPMQQTPDMTQPGGLLAPPRKKKKTNMAAQDALPDGSGSGGMDKSLGY